MSSSTCLFLLAVLCVQVHIVPAGPQGRPHAAHQPRGGGGPGPHTQHGQCELPVESPWLLYTMCSWLWCAWLLSIYIVNVCYCEFLRHPPLWLVCVNTVDDHRATHCGMYGRLCMRGILLELCAWLRCTSLFGATTFSIKLVYFP
jgi:hypothetical protein